ncbi:MAG: hypothetical protein AAFX44_06565 [Pseudomonadota bacterium]
MADLLRKINGDDDGKAGRVETATGVASRPKKGAHSGIERVVDALRRIPRSEYAAVLAAVTDDSNAVSWVRAALTAFARKRQSLPRTVWPTAVRRHRLPTGHLPCEAYEHDLVTMAISELRAPAAFRSNRMRAEWFHVPERTYYRQLAAPYSEVWDQLQIWYTDGVDRITRAIGGHR